MSPRHTHSLLVAIAVLLIQLVGNANASLVRLTMQSQPGDYIGQGTNYDITYDTALGSTISAQIRRSVLGSPAELLFVLNSGNLPGNSFALLSFGTDALGIPIQPGTYNDAQRADFATSGHPGLDVSFQNRGSNTITGKFIVTTANFYTDRFGAEQVLDFSASFEQHSEGARPALFGTFSFFAVPEPATALFGFALMGVVAAGRHRRR